MTATLRQVGPSDGSAWRALQLRALRKAPDAFASSLAEWTGPRDGEETWHRQLEAGVNFIATLGTEDVGMVSGSLVDGGRGVELFSMYVDPMARGRGIGDLLIAAVTDWARDNTEALAVELDVRSADRAARALYKRHGFIPTTSLPGDDKKGLRMSLAVPRIRFGVHSGQQYPSFTEISALWRVVEQLGYAWMSVFDHYRPEIFGPDGPCLDGPTVLSALAASTPRLRCGLLVAAPHWRHPAQLAAIAATLDQVSDGRLELGLGVGGADLAFQQWGIPRLPVAERFERLDEYAEVVRLLWSGGPVSYLGRRYELSDAYLRPAPVQRCPSLTIGGIGIRKTLPLVARHADIWNAGLTTPDRYAQLCAVLAELCVTEGRPPETIRRSMTFRCVVDPTATSGAPPAGVPKADRAEYLCIGSAQQCVDSLLPYLQLGVRDFLLGLRPPIDWGTLERFAIEVVPVLRHEARSP